MSDQSDSTGRLSGRDAEAVIALNRFGLGARAGDIERIRSDPRGALLEEIARADAALITDPALPSSAAAITRQLYYERGAKRARLAARAAPAANAPVPVAMRATTDGKTGMDAGMSGGMSAGNMAAGNMASAQPSASPLAQLGPAPASTIYEQEVAARMARLRAVPIGFCERLVQFWANHFCIALKDPPVRSMAGAYEREAIRPYALGSYAGMLKAAEQHPSMLIYLDNTQSVGPNSDVALGRRTRGLNENLARELMELHTLGVDGGYSQADVTALARIITGWIVIPPDDDAFNGGTFTFAPARHEPGDQTLLGRVFPAGGVEQGEAVLTMLAEHPSTARHVVRKFAAHFVADDPPPALVARLEANFRASGGDLGELARTLVRSPEAWQPELRKVRSPQEFLFAVLRLTGQPDQAKHVLGHLATLGQPVWNPGSPKGYSDRTDDWLSPTGIAARLDAADQIARAVKGAEPLDLVAAALGDTASEETLRTIRRAESRPQGIAIALMAPEFQRR